MLSLLLACTSDPLDLSTKDPTGRDTAAPGGGDTAAPGEVSVSDLSARLHDTYRSVVYVHWTQSEATEGARVEYSFDDGVWESTPEIAGTAGEHEQIVLGVPYGVTLHWRLVLRSGSEESTTDGPDIDTEADPGLPDRTVEISEESGWDPDAHFLLTSVSIETPMVSTRPEFWVVIVDRQGRYVWAHAANPKSWTLFAKPSREGDNILYDDSLFWTAFDGGEDGMVHSLKLDGTVVHEWATPGLDHAFDDLDDDTIVWTAQEGQDVALRRMEASKSSEALWSCNDWLKAEGLSSGGWGGGNCGCNSLSWDDVSSTYVLSLWSQELVVQLDLEHDQTLWFASSGGDGYSIDSEAVWAWEHEANLLPNGHLLLSSGVGGGQGHGGYDATAAYEYAINPDTQTLDLVWSYVGEHDWASQYKGGAHRLAGGNTVHYYGSHPGVKEIAPDGTVVWQMEFDDSSWIGRSTWLDDLYAFVGD